LHVEIAGTGRAVAAGESGWIFAFEKWGNELQ